LKLLHDGDSAVFEYPSDSVFKGVPDAQRPPYIKKGSISKFEITIKKVMTKAEFMANMDKLRKEQAVANESKRGEMIMQIQKFYGEEKIKKDNDAIDKYLADKKLKAITSPTGLRYIIEQDGSDAITPGTTVMVNYTGMLLSGKIFDTSVEEVAKKNNMLQPGRPYSPFELMVGEGRVIPGWDEGLTYFKKGSKGKLIIPSYLGYADKGSGEIIPPYSCLVFDIDIVDIKK
jgi:FKBP-type peptidyl-prolyl cis-trans isomerase